MSERNDHPWWERGTVYQIYPRSFQDSDGDGVGDLAGIERRLDHVVSLGVDAIWLSPIFPSPMADFGYDVADYCGVEPLFGDLAAFDRLLAAVHARGLKLLLDFVPNHTSDRHPWFVESRRGRDSAKRDWYIWRDPAPDWRPGITERDRLIQQHSTDQPEAHAIAAEMRALADGYGAGAEGRVLIGEIFLPNDRHARWYGTPERPQVHLPFNFQLIENAWDAATLRAMIAAYEASLPPHGWPNWVIGSHDAPRIAARIGEAQARVAAMLLLTLRGTPTLYQGDEIGIGEVDIPPERVRDPQELRQPGIGIGRDRSRTPMPWDASPFAGFSSAEPWLPLNPDWPLRNVAAQERDAGSMLVLYRRLLALRRAHPALSIGDFRLLEAADGVLAYERRHGEEVLRVALNMTRRAITFHWAGDALASTLDGDPEPGMLYADEGLIFRP